MTHSYHQTRHIVFDDDCEECQDRAANPFGLLWLDNTNLALLADILTQRINSGAWPEDASTMDQVAANNLHTMALLVARSGVDQSLFEETIR